MTADAPTRSDETTELPTHPPSRGTSGAWRIVARREMLVRLTDRNFLIGTGVTLLLLVGLVAVQILLATRASDVAVAVTQSAAASVVQETNERVQADDDGSITAVTVPDRETGLAQVREGEVDALLEQRPSGWLVTYHRDSDSSLDRELGASIEQATLRANAAAAGTSIETLTAGSSLETARLDGMNDDESGFRIVVGVILAMLFYFASLTFGMQIATSVVEEKQSRIVEILTTAIPVEQLLIGKVVGNTALAFGQMVLYAGVGLIGVSFTSFQGLLPSLAGTLGWFLAFFVAGFLALACIWAAAGSLASRFEDLQATSTPISAFLVVAFIAGISTSGAIQTVLSFVPVLSAITMPGRIISGEAAWWEPVVALGLTAAFAAVTISVGARIYRRSVLQTGRRLRYRDAWRASA